MANDQPSAGPPSFDPLPGWPSPPDGPPSPARPPSAPPPGWVETPPPWAQAAPQGGSGSETSTAPPPGGSERPSRRRTPVIVAVAVAVLLAGIATIAVLASRGNGSKNQAARSPVTAGTQPSAGGQARRILPPPTGGGNDLTVLGGKVVVAARAGWETLDSTDDTASIRLALMEPTGRELLTTMVIVALPGPGSLDTTLRLDGGTAFEVKGTDGPLRVTALPGGAPRIVAGAERPKGTFYLSLSIYAIDGQDIDLATLRTLFTEQVAPAVRFP